MSKGPRRFFLAWFAFNLICSFAPAFAVTEADFALRWEQIKRLPDFATFIDTSFVDALKPL